MPGASSLQPIIDAALAEPTPAHWNALLHARHEPVRLAERVRERATRLARRSSGRRETLLATRDTLIQEIYRAAAPDLATAWCDGAVQVKEDGRRCAIGMLVLDRKGTPVVSRRRPIEAADAFSTEIAALEATLVAAATRRIDRLRVHTDCAALANLWRTHRDDPRLAGVRALRRKFRRLEIVAVPRLHNQPAHRLARSALEEG